jgi:hypothetical protein
MAEKQLGQYVIALIAFTYCFIRKCGINLFYFDLKKIAALNATTNKGSTNGLKITT